MTKDLKNELRHWGKYVAKENCLYLFDNAFLQDKQMLDILKANNVKIQLDLFT